MTTSLSCTARLTKNLSKKLLRSQKNTSRSYARSRQESSPTQAQSRLPEFLRLRGGRISKRKGLIVSFAPFLATVSFAALNAVVLSTGPAIAGSCTQSAPGSGIWTCSGAAAVGDVTQNPTSAPGGALQVTTAPGFGINVSAANNNGISLNTSGTSAITFTDANASSITANGRGIYSRNTGTGSTMIAVTGDVSGGSGGIEVTKTGSGETRVTTGDGAISGNGNYSNAISVYKETADLLSRTAAAM